MKNIRLNNGYPLPEIGFGTFKWKRMKHATSVRKPCQPDTVTSIRLPTMGMKRVWERKRPPPPADESWELMEAYVKEGRGKTIGVCNYTSAMLDDLMSRLSLVPPHERAEREE